ncbi:MAG TPA: MBL fold metallo-hydrolase [Steroidobacteraceae bacterium]|nr:MBL fold metallo-hydrolase [Steroidobacteraceae bacterium]
MRGSIVRSLLALPAALVTAAVCAQTAQPQQEPRPADDSVEITSQRLRPGLHVLMSGRNGNIGVWNGADGIVVIDDSLAPLAPRVAEAIGRIAEGPIRFVINTHWHPDHTGGNELLGKSGGVVVAHENVRTRLSEEQFIALLDMRVPPAPAGALPVVTFDDSVTLYLNGDRLDVVHVSDAHTDGDAVLWWQAANVVHTGDVYLSGTYPFVDLDSGGTLAGLVAALEAILARVNDATLIIPGHGPMSNRRELSDYRDMIVTVGRRIREGVESGRNLEEVLASRPTAEFDARYGQGFMTPTRLVGILYRDLTRPKPALKPSGRN